MRRFSWTILAVAAIIFVAAYSYKFAPPSGWQLSSNTEQWARFGAYIGGAFGMLAFIGVLITVDIQSRQLDLQRHQVTLDELLRFSRDLASAIDETLKQPVERGNAETAAQKLDLLATSLAEYTRLSGSRVIVALYRDRYRTTVARLGRLDASMKMQNWWAASFEQPAVRQAERKEPTL
jgi:predicted hydrolase (HD superfamily)